MRLESRVREKFGGPHVVKALKQTEIVWGEDVQRMSSKGAPGALGIQSSGSGEDPAKGTAKEQPVQNEENQQVEVLEAGENVPGAVWGPFR